MTKKQTSSYQEFIGKPEISFWLPIIFTAVSIAISFATLTMQQALTRQELVNSTAMLEQKLNQILDNQKEIIVWKNQFEGRLEKEEKTNAVQDEKLATLSYTIKNLGVK